MPPPMGCLSRDTRSGTSVMVPNAAPTRPVDGVAGSSVPIGTPVGRSMVRTGPMGGSGTGEPIALPDGAIADPPTARPLRAAAAVSGDGIERATDRLRHHLHRCSVVFIPRAGRGPE